MDASSRASSSTSLPIRGSLAFLYVSSLAIVLLLVVAAAAGILYRDRIYVTDELAQGFVATDVVSLLIGVPILLGSMWLTRRGKLIGLLFWPGALMYVLYDHFAYIQAMPLGWILLVHMALFALSAYTTIGLVASIDARAVQERLGGTVPARFAGGVLVGLGVLFLLLAIGTIGGAIANQTPLPEAKLAVWITDSVIVPAWIIGGIVLWRREAFGYVIGAGLLFQGSMLFVGLIVVLLLQPLLTAAPFALTDVIVVAVMGLVCFVPFGLFVRAVLKSGA